MEENKRKRLVIIPKYLVVLIVIFLGLLSLYIYDKSLFPVTDVKLKPGVYEFVGEDGGRIVVSEGNKIMFQDFDLNTHLRGVYKEETDLNRMFLNNSRTFRILRGVAGVYSVIYDVDEYNWLEIDYYPREDKLILLKPRSKSEFLFMYRETCDVD